MPRTFRPAIAGAVMALAAVLSAAGPARADLAIELVANGHTLEIGPTAADALTAGPITFQGFKITIVNATVNSASTTDTLTNTQVQVVNLKKSTQSIEILASANNLTLPTGSRAVTQTGSVTFAKPGDSFTTQAFGSNSNTLFDQSQFAGTPISFTSTPGNLSGGGTVTDTWVNGGSPFSLTSANTLTLLAGHKAVSTASATLTQTPEPSTALLALAGLPLLALGARPGAAGV